MKHYNVFKVGAGMILASTLAFGIGSAVVQAVDSVDVRIIAAPAQPATRPTPEPPADLPLPMPDYVQPNGALDMSKLPKCFKKLDKEGKIEKDKDGKEICIPSQELYAPPPVPQP